MRLKKETALYLCNKNYKNISIKAALSGFCICERE